MTRLLSALIGGFPVIVGRCERIAAPGKWKVHRSEGRLIVEILA
jgi:hypothetical protein